MGRQICSNVFYSCRPQMSSRASMESMSSHYEAVRPRASPHGGPAGRPPAPAIAPKPPMSAAASAMAASRLHHQGPASTATRELDDLMASLSDFKVGVGQVHTVKGWGLSRFNIVCDVFLLLCSFPLREISVFCTQHCKCLFGFDIDVHCVLFYCVCCVSFYVL